ncbi:hypothetical protein BLD44_027805 [Mastigocladus laminosus UU774]|nr:hypothetical protein BLD44_027805 [Mastigocladus laminosus UU774]
MSVTKKLLKSYIISAIAQMSARKNLCRAHDSMFQLKDAVILTRKIYSLADWEHVNFARTYELVSGGKINENRGRNQFLLNNETSQSEKTPETSPSRSKNSVSRSRD